jgi:hypothetical protein
VIAPDTSLVHLAGALGRPVFLPLIRIADWRWFIGREDSPWYPNLRIFRQNLPGDWPEVFSRIAPAVRALANPS